MINRIKPVQNIKTFNIYFLLNKDAHLLDLAGPIQAFHEASKRGAAIELHYIGFENELTSHQGLQFSNIKAPPETLEDNAIIIISASHYNETVYSDSSSLESITWLKQIANNTPDLSADHSQTPLIVGICTGSILLAKANLLNGRRCTTHHSLRGVIETQYPKVNFEWERIFVEDSNVITTAGVTAGLDLALHLIERLFGYEMSLQIARDLVVYRRRMSNDPQLSIHVQYRNHVHPVVHNVQDYIQTHFQQKISQQTLADLQGVSMRHLQRIFKQATGTTIHQYLNYYRTEHAKGMMSQHSNIEYIAHASGFPNSNSLRQCLKQFDA